MQLNEYQSWADSTALYPKASAFEYLTLGLCSEAGEVAGKAKKVIRDGVYEQEAFIAELGDVFWYLTQLCTQINVKAEDVLRKNVWKLEERKRNNTIKGNGDFR